MKEIRVQPCGSWVQLILGLGEARKYLPKLCLERRVKTRRRGKYLSLRRFSLAVYSVRGLHLLLHSHSISGMYKVKS